MGAMTRPTAQQNLVQPIHPNGTFMIRESAEGNRRGEYALSLKYFIFLIHFTTKISMGRGAVFQHRTIRPGFAESVGEQIEDFSSYKITTNL